MQTIICTLFYDDAPRRLYEDENNEIHTTIYRGPRYK